MYKLFYRKEILKSLKKIKRSNSKKFVKEFQEIFSLISEKPKSVSIPYTGNLAGFFKYCHGDSPEYRIIYAIYPLEYIVNNPDEFDDCDLSDDDLKNIDGVVDIVFLRTREDCNNLYKQKLKFFQDKKR